MEILSLYPRPRLPFPRRPHITDTSPEGKGPNGFPILTRRYRSRPPHRRRRLRRPHHPQGRRHRRRHRLRPGRQVLGQEARRPTQTIPKSNVESMTKGNAPAAPATPGKPGAGPAPAATGGASLHHYPAAPPDRHHRPRRRHPLAEVHRREPHQPRPRHRSVRARTLEEDGRRRREKINGKWIAGEEAQGPPRKGQHPHQGGLGTDAQEPDPPGHQEARGVQPPLPQSPSAPISPSAT